MKTRETVIYNIIIAALLLSLFIGFGILFFNLQFSLTISGILTVSTSLSTLLPLLLRTLQGLDQRKSVSITIKIDDNSIVAQNLTSKDAQKLLEVFQTLEKGHFTVALPEPSNHVTSQESVLPDTSLDDASR